MSVLLRNTVIAYVIIIIFLTKLKHSIDILSFLENLLLF